MEYYIQITRKNGNHYLNKYSFDFINENSVFKAENFYFDKVGVLNAISQKISDNDLPKIKIYKTPKIDYSEYFFTKLKIDLL